MAMIGISLSVRKPKQIGWVRSILLGLSITLIGIVCDMFLFFIENGYFSGLSYFGAVLLAPLLIFPLSKLLKIPYTDYLDVAAPCGCGMLTVMKVNCFLAGCCQGRVISQNATGEVIRFPSQIVEGIAALILTTILILLIWKNRFRHLIFPLFMFSYGISRFILNAFRETTPVWLHLPFGNIWAIVAVIIGTVWIILYDQSQKKKNASVKSN